MKKIITEVRKEKHKRLIYKQRLKMLNLNKVQHLDFELLRKNYEFISKQLTKKYLNSTVRTRFEFRFEKLLNQYTKLQYFKSFWIVNRNVDFFIPNLRAIQSLKLQASGLVNINSGYGLAIEINGCIHFDESKMRKDNSKSNFLHDLRIIELTINNEDINSRNIHNIIKQIKNLRRLDFRAKRRLLKNIYIHTLIFHCDEVHFGNLFLDERQQG